MSLGWRAVGGRLATPATVSPMHTQISRGTGHGRTRHARIGISLAVAALAATAAPARADTVTDWNDAASTAIVGVAKQPPPVAIMSFAMVQGAVYDAVEAIDGRYRPYLATPPARHSDSEDAAAATAAFRVLAGLFPAQLPTLQVSYDASLAAIPAGPRKDR